MKWLFSVMIAIFSAQPTFAQEAKSEEFKYGPQSCRILYSESLAGVAQKFITQVQEKGLPVLSADKTQALAFNDFIVESYEDKNSPYQLSAIITKGAKVPLWRGTLDQLARVITDDYCTGLNTQAKKGYEDFSIKASFRARLTNAISSRQLAPGLSQLLIQQEALELSRWWDFPQTVVSINNSYASVLRRTQAAWNIAVKKKYFDRIDAIRKVLINEMQNFCDEKSKMTSLLIGDCGNKEAQTLLITSLFLDMKMQHEPGYYFALQVYENSVRPVIFTKDKVSGERVIVDLVYGEIETGVSGDLFNPELISFAYLFEHGAARMKEREGLRYELTDLTKMDPMLGLYNFFDYYSKPEKNYSSSFDFGPTFSKYVEPQPTEGQAQIVFQSIHKKSSQQGGEGQAQGEGGQPGGEQEEQQGNPGDPNQAQGEQQGQQGQEQPSGPQIQIAQPIGSGRFGDFAKQNGLEGTGDVDGGPQGEEGEGEGSSMSTKFKPDDTLIGDDPDADSFLRSPRVRQQAEDEELAFLDGLDFILVPTSSEVKDQEPPDQNGKVVKNPLYDIIFRNGSELARQWQSTRKGQDKFYLLKDQVDAQLTVMMSNPHFDRVSALTKNFLSAVDVYEDERLKLLEFQYNFAIYWNVGDALVNKVFRNFVKLEERDDYWQQMLSTDKVNAETMIPRTQYYRTFHNGYSHPAVETLCQILVDSFVALSKDDQAERTLLSWNAQQRSRFFRFFNSVMVLNPLVIMSEKYFNPEEHMELGVSEEVRHRAISPLLPLFEKIVLSGEYSIDPSVYVPVPKEHVILVEVEQGGKWQPLPKDDKTLTPPSSSQDETDVKKEEKETAKPSYEAKIVSRDTVLGLLINMNNLVLKVPLVQMKTFVIWDQEMSNAFVDQYKDIDAAFRAYMAVWSWGPALTSPSFKARQNGYLSPIFSQAAELNIPFMRAYEELKASPSGSVGQVIVQWDQPMYIAELPDIYQAFSNPVAQLMQQIFKRILPEQAKAQWVTFEEHEDSGRIAAPEKRWSGFDVFYRPEIYKTAGIREEVTLYPRQDMKVRIERFSFDVASGQNYYRINDGEINYVLDFANPHNNRFILE